MTQAQGRTGRISNATSLADTVYDTIHHNIVTGRYRPNQRLVESEIAAELKASRTPVRAALFRLVRDGLAVKGSQGLRVREFDLAEIREIYVVRSALEGLAASLAAKSGDQEALDRAGESLERHTSISMSVPLDKAAVVSANAEFHQAVLEASGNERLVKLATINNAYFFNYEVAPHTSEASIRLALNEHTEIYAALRRGDGDAAERIVRDHILSALSTIESIF